MSTQLIIQGSEPIKEVEALRGEITSEKGLQELLNKTFDSLTDGEAVEIKIYRKYILVGKRLKNHGSEYYKKFTNYGLGRGGNKSRSLSFAIHAIDGGSLKEYCYDAINGDVNALRQTTKHLVRAYEAKIKRLKEKGKKETVIKYYEKERDKIVRRLEKDDDEFLELSEPVLVEIPKNPDVFYGDRIEIVSITGDDNITVEE